MNGISQIEVTREMASLVSDIQKPINQGKLVAIRDKMYSKLEIRNYNDSTAEHEKSIRWKRTATQILSDGYVYKGKSCTDLAVLFISLCNALGLETRFVKLRKNGMVHSIAEVELEDGRYIFDVSNQSNVPIKGEVTKENPYKDWELWKKSKDAWDLGLSEFNSINKIQ